MKAVRAHAFVPGQAGSYQALYCQALPEPGTEITPGYRPRVCGYLESAHTMTAEQEAANDQAQVAEILRRICR